MATQHKAKSGGARKHGRNKQFNVRYTAEKRYDRNRKRRLTCHISRKEKEIERKAKKGRIIKMDLQAVRALQALT